MARLNQIIALVKGRKAEVQSALTLIYHQCQKTDLFAGLVKTYEPSDEEGERYPGDEKRLQLRVEELLQQVGKESSKLFDVVELQDRMNCETKANVVVDGAVVLNDVPPTHLLFLEHKLVDFITLLEKIPVLDPAKNWSYSDEGRCFRSDPIRRTKTKKVPRFKSVAEATVQHPEQVVQITEDIVEGTWTTVEFSGAVSEERKHQLISRARKLKDAVIAAREEANSAKVGLKPSVGKSVFDFLLKEDA